MNILNLEERLVEINRSIKSLLDENVLDRETISYIQESCEDSDQTNINFEDVERLYQEAGVQLPGVALEAFEKVKEFHQSIIRNRRAWLEPEIISAKERIAKRESEIGDLITHKENLILLLENQFPRPGKPPK